MAVGENLRRWRERRAMSQDDLSVASGVGQNTIWRIEREGRQPRPSTLRKLAAALKVDPAELLEGEAAGLRPVVGAREGA